MSQHKPKIDFDRYKSYTSNIINSRLLKLLKLSMAELSLEDERGLTISEKELYENLYNYIKVWRNFFLT
jgi:DNA replication initiation complex subunit (GINS family)